MPSFAKSVFPAPRYWNESLCGNPVQAGFLDEGNGPVVQPIPYGAMPRLALAWVSTYAKRHKTREIPIGDSAAEFLRLVGMDSQGNRSATRPIHDPPAFPRPLVHDEILLSSAFEI